jgi:hypothetical protein
LAIRPRCDGEPSAQQAFGRTVRLEPQRDVACRRTQPDFAQVDFAQVNFAQVT